VRTSGIAVFSVWAALFAACSDCGKPHTVPFRVDAGQPATTGATPPLPNTPAPFVPIDGLVVPPGTRALPVDGAPLEVPGHTLAAVVPLDLDADGDRDALVVSSDANGTPSLEMVPRTPPHFGAPRAVGALALGAGCTLEAATMRVIAPTFALVTVTPRCAMAMPPAPAPPTDLFGFGPKPPPAAPPVIGTPDTAPRLFLVALGPLPRVRERFAVLPEAGREPGAMTLALRVEDRDADGTADVLLDVSMTLPGAAAPTQLALPWLERPSGLARDTKEPEAQFAERAARAKRSLRRDPDGALALAGEVLALHGALCREPGRARLVVGTSEGIPCRASAAAGQAAAIAAQALARKGALLAALDAWETLERPGTTVSRADRDATRRALAAMPAEAGATWREGPAHAFAGGPDQRLSSLAFTPAGDALLLRGGTSASTWSLADGALTPAMPEQGEVLLREPGGALAIVDVHRTCRGYALGVVPASSVVAGVFVGAYATEPLVAEAPPPSGARCDGSTSALPAASRRDDGGFRVLGWAPQGAIVARGAELRLVSLAPGGAANGDATLLEDGVPAPAPLPAGAMDPSGTAHAWATPFGVVVHERGARARVSLLRPEGWADVSATVGDVAISPDARRVAVVVGGTVRLIERAAP
jgi:hypothetical protein